MAKRANGEGSIYRRKVDGMYVGSISTENGRKYFYSKKRQEVAEKINAALLEKRQGTLVTTSQQSLTQYLEYWLEHGIKNNVRPRTYERYEGIVRLHIVPTLGKVKLQSLKPQQVQVLLSRKLKEGLSASTVGLVHVVLHKALDDAVKLSLLSRNVCDAVSSPHEEKAEINVMTFEQVKDLLRAAKEHPLEPLIVLALTTGMRRGELLGLKWQDVNFTGAVLQVRRALSRVPTQLARETGELYVESEPKTKSGRRSIMLVDRAVDVLVKHRAHQNELRLTAGSAWEDHDYVFCTAVGRHLHPGSSVLEPFKVLLKRAGLPDMRFHDLRHNAATLLLGLGVQPKVVQEILGHSKFSMTMDLYSHVMPTMQRDAVDRFNRALERMFGEDKSQEDTNSGSDSAK